MDRDTLEMVSGANAAQLDEVPAEMWAIADDFATFDVEEFLSGVEFGFDGSGETAWIEEPADFEDLMMVYVGGEWKIDLPVEDEGGMMEGMLDQFRPLVDAMKTGIEATATAVQSGEFGDEVEMMVGMQGKMFQAVMESPQAAQLLEQMNQGGGLPGVGGG